MKLTQLRWLLIALLGFVVLLNIFAPMDPETVGLSSQWSNGNYHFAAGTDPRAVAEAVLLIGLYALLMHASPNDSARPLPGIFRRFVAFLCDLTFAMFALAPILGIIPAILEWHRTGEFEWAFERDTPVASDIWVTLLGTLLVFVALLFYFALPLIRRKPSPGACILGYQVIPDDGTNLTVDKALLRTLLGFTAACAPYIAPFVARDRKKGKFWVDQVFHTRAVLF